ncbi:MAG: hypothetical protein ACLFNI_04330 [Natronomonas sp.]
MKDYIVENEEQLSPTVIVMTILLVAAFGMGIVYQIVGFLL